MADANQVWDVPQAIEWMKPLQRFNLRWIEEPTSPDDVLGHATIRNAIAPTKVATGEHAHNRVMFKQLLQAGAIDYAQIDACRLGGLNENIVVMLLCAAANVPVCPHAGGIGLCEYVQHLSMIDYVSISGSLDDRTTEFAGHLHEHFIDPPRLLGGKYLVPEQPGFSAEMWPDSIRALSYPNGSAWQ
jgi:L-fuconate dehydratase